MGVLYLLIGGLWRGLTLELHSLWIIGHVVLLAGGVFIKGANGRKVIGRGLLP